MRLYDFACVLACTFTLTPAFRYSESVGLGATLRAASNTSEFFEPEVDDMFRHVLSFECVVRLFDAYVQIIGEDEIRNVMLKAVESIRQIKPKPIPFAKIQDSIREKRHKPKINRDPLITQLENARIDKLQALDAELYPKCAVGAPVIPCALTLPPRLWVEQKLILKRVKDALRSKICPKLLCKSIDPTLNETSLVATFSLFQEAVKQTKYSISRAEHHCEKQKKKPSKSAVRECMLEASTPWWKHDIRDVLKTKWSVEDKKETFLAMGSGVAFHVLPVDRMNGRWKEWSSKKEVKEWDDQVQEQDQRLEKMDGFNYQNAIQKCEKQANPSALRNAELRTQKELQHSCNKDVFCEERIDALTPSGYACDRQRKYNAGGFFAGVALGEFVSWGINPLVLIATTGPISVGAFIGAFFAPVPTVIPGVDVVLMATFGSMLSRNPIKECAPFPLKCGRGEEGGPCRMMSDSPTVHSSKNPMARLPIDGLKCVPVYEKSKPVVGAVHLGKEIDANEDKNKCEVQPCVLEDLIEDGPVTGLFGRVGTHNGGTYNCANTGKTTGTQLGILDNIPALSPDGNGISESETVPNTVEARNALLSMYPGVAGMEKGFKPSRQYKVDSCPADIQDEMLENFRILKWQEQTPGRLYLTCKDQVATKSNTFKASCRTEDCQGRPWCFVQNGCNNRPIRAPMKKCKMQPVPQCEMTNSESSPTNSDDTDVASDDE